MQRKDMWCLALMAVGMVKANGVSAADDVVNIERFQPSIVNQTAPIQQHSWNIPDNVRAARVAGFSAIVPSYNGKGNLIASWNPRGGRVADRPTFIIVHGGHGLAPSNFASAEWMIRELDANVLLLNSYWSRGQNENWRTWNEMGVNMRLLDAIAAARFTRSQGANPKKTFLIGDSQGGWTVLRTFTAGHLLEQEVWSLYQGAADDGTPADACVAYYTELNRGGANIQWKIYPDAHHGFDGSTPRTYLPQGVTAKNCSIEVFLTDVKGGGLGEARNYKTGQPIQGFGEWNREFAACNSSGFTVAENRPVREQAVKEALAFIRSARAVPQTSAPVRVATPMALTEVTHEQRTAAILRELAAGEK